MDGGRHHAVDGTSPSPSSASLTQGGASEKPTKAKKTKKKKKKGRSRSASLSPSSDWRIPKAQHSPETYAVLSSVVPSAVHHNNGTCTWSKSTSPRFSKTAENTCKTQYDVNRADRCVCRALVREGARARERECASVLLRFCVRASLCSFVSLSNQMSRPPNQCLTSPTVDQSSDRRTEPSNGAAAIVQFAGCLLHQCQPTDRRACDVGHVGT